MTGLLQRGRRRSAVVAVAIVALLVTVSAGPMTPSTGLGATTTGGAVSGVLAPTVAPGGAAPTASASAGMALSPSSAGTVVRTVYLDYNTSTAGNFPSSVWDWRAGRSTVDPTTGDLWIPEWPVSVDGIPAPALAPALVFDPATNQTEAVPGLSNASAVAYDPLDGYLYATQPLANDVVAFDPTTSQTVGAPIPVGSAPDDILFDPVSGDLFVANNGSANLTVLDGSTGSVVDRGLSVGAHPSDLADDTVDGKLFVADAASLFVSVVNTTTRASGVSIPTPEDPTTVAYSPGSDVLAIGMPDDILMDLVDAATQAVSAFATVGLGVTSIAVTPAGEYFVLANGTGDRLTTVLASTSPTATLGPSPPTGPDPVRVTAGVSGGTVFAWSAEKRALSVVNVTADADTERAPDLGVESASLAFDPNSDRVFLSDAENSSVLVLNATDLATAASPIGLPAPALSVVDDPVTGVVYAGYDGGIAAIDAMTSASVTSVSGGNASGNNSELLVDAASGRLWDVNGVHGLESFALTDLRSLGPVGDDVGVRGGAGVALDPASDGLFVVNATGATLTEFNGSTGAEVGSTVSGIPGLVSVAYDAADQELYALGRELWIVDPENESVVAGPIAIAPHTVAWSVVYDPSREYLYIPSNDSLNSAWPGNLTVLDGASVSASEGSYVSIPVGQLPVGVASVELPGTTAPGASEIWVVNYLSGTVSVVASPPSITYFAADPDPVDAGSTTTFELGLVGGAGPSTISYTGLPSGCGSADQNELVCVPEVNGSYPVLANVVDVLGQNTSALSVLSVAPTIELEVTVESVPVGEVDVGEAFLASVAASGGTAPYNYTWSFGDGTGAWGSAVSHDFAATGSYLVTVLATDAGGGVSSATTLVVVEPLPSVALTALPGNVTDVNVSLELTANVSGGTAPGNGTWILGNGVNESGDTVRYAYRTPGVYFATFEYVDASGVSVSRHLDLLVHPAPSARWSVAAVSSGSAIDAGTPLDFNATISGGTAPYTVIWSFDDGTYAYGISAQHAYASSGTYTVTLFVEDAVGASWNGTYRLVVGAASSNSVLGVPFDSGLLLGVLVGAAVGAVLLLLAARPRKSAPAPAPTPYVPPAEVEDGTPWREE